MKTILVLLAVAATTLGTARAQGAGSSMGSTPNYSPSPGTKSPAKMGGKPASNAGSKVVVSSGGQGHNSGPDPKGKIMVAPSASPAKTGQGAAKSSSGKQ